MKSIQVFEPAQSGTRIDPALVDFTADVDWSSQQGAPIERFDLAQQPLEFAQNAVVKSFLEHAGQDALPLVLVDGEMALTGRYPTRGELARWAGLAQPTLQPVRAGDCCSGGNCG
ncbi:arsenic metallochaperone ArsD family protein [Thauera phenolivorans]|uniref:arsenic metallochaperone ArsD family protein n=1 Tax=Thauera phenolivorans TaxID=1792543 RepID=UPI00083A13C7|nr:arsenic metallochaperone ArsD family protein [Thauera phenolivorans]